MLQKTCRFFTIALLLCCIVFSFTGCGEAEKAYNKAVELMESGKYKDSLVHFEDALKENSEKAEYYIAYGMALNSTGSYKEAIKEFSRAYQDTDNKISRQNNKRLYMGQAFSYYNMGNTKKAIEACDKALSYGKEPDIDIRINNIKAMAYILAGNTDEALGIYNNIIEEDNTQAGTYSARALLYETLGKDSMAVKDYESAVKYDKKCYDAYFSMYNIYKRLGDKEKADKVLESFKNPEKGTAEETMQLGRAYYYKEDYKNAKEILNKAIKDGCNEALYYLGTVYMAENNYQAAAGSFEDYIKTGITDKAQDSYNQMAGCYINLGDFETASSCIDKGIALNKGVSGAGMALLKNRVILYEKMGKYKKAKKAANSYLKKFPGDKDMEKELGFIKTRIKTIQIAEDSKKEQQ